ncbi:doublecortin domain-containing protein 2C isoform X2 [Talpa occidentalis]|uniref:doublecortin domain-containing protein 2C isoform X2 n=1 Tax=Talpa occidentalis TaxID=50954 RepID=UPI0023F83511|nr:doublecortin domain-containing protein 2C isoform X2 [Talpa occidentalis]
MGARGPHVLVDTTPARTILVYRNGDPFFAGRKFVLSRRRVASFEALLEQLTEQVAVPCGVRRLFTPVRGHLVRELDALLQAGGKYVAAGRERFKKLDYARIEPRAPAKARRRREIKPVVHCDINVPSRWQTYHRLSRCINVFTNGSLFTPPAKVIIPKFTLTDWNSVLAMVGEKVFPLGGVHRLFTLTGRLLDSSEGLQENHFYVAAGLEAFKHFPYWQSPRVPDEVQRKYADAERPSHRKSKEEPEGKDAGKQDSLPRAAQDSVYYARERQTAPAQLLPESGTGDVYKAQTPHAEIWGAPDVKEDLAGQVEVPVDQMPAKVVREEAAQEQTPDLGSTKEDSSRVSFKKKFPIRHNTKKKATVNLSKNKKLVSLPEKEQHGLKHASSTPALAAAPGRLGGPAEPPREDPAQEDPAPRQAQEDPEARQLLEPPPAGRPSWERRPGKKASPEGPPPKQSPQKRESRGAQTEQQAH